MLKTIIDVLRRILQSSNLENIVEKAATASQKYLFESKGVHTIFGSWFNKFLSYGSLIHLSVFNPLQDDNFRLFQTERVCRRQFQIRRKWQKAIQMGRKHWGKWRNCSLPAISPFPTVFSKGLFPRGVNRCHCVAMG